MKKKSNLGIVVIVIAVICVNVFLSIDTAKACYPWEPGYDPITGECGNPPAPSGETGVQGRSCSVYNGEEWVVVGYERNCVWAVVGSCTPFQCPWGTI